MGGIVAAVAGIAGGIMSSQAAKKAGDQQAGQSQQALQFQQGVYNDMVQGFAPYISSGGNALNALNQFYGLPSATGVGTGGNALDAYRAFTQTPFYQFPLQQAQEASERSAAAHGLGLSFGQRNELQKLSANYAGSQFNTYRDALASLAGLGQASVAARGQQGNQAAITTSTIQDRIGNALAAGTIGQQNGINSALNQLPLLLTGSNPTGSNNSTTSGYSGNTSRGGLFGLLSNI